MSDLYMAVPEVVPKSVLGKGPDVVWSPFFGPAESTPLAGGLGER